MNMRVPYTVTITVHMDGMSPDNAADNLTYELAKAGFIERTEHMQKVEAYPNKSFEVGEITF